MKETGERIIIDTPRQDKADYLCYLVHLATYMFAEEFVRGKKVLDFGCGSGYGTFMLSKVAAHITGADISREAILYAKSHFNNEHLFYMAVDRIEERGIPFADETFDVVVSFQVIEHIHNTDMYLSEIRRILKKAGLFIFATPDRTSRLFSFQKPWNVFHVKEFSPKTILKYLSNVFQGEQVKLYQTSAHPDLLKAEIKRAARLKYITLPFTLPFFPEFYRRAGLFSLKFINGMRSSIRKLPAVDYSLDYSVEDVWIREEAEVSLDIVGVCKK